MAGSVLIIDDDQGVLDTIRLVLAREGYDVLTASDGKSAIELMSRRDCSAKVCTVLCDLEMPDMGGKELIDYFRKNFPDIPIIIISGASDTVFLDGIVQQGVCDWIRKPVNRETLLDKVRKGSNLYSLRRQCR